MINRPQTASLFTVRSDSARSFTLVELLVVMGIIAVMAGLTVLGYRAVAKDAKLAAGKNTVMAVLDNARSLAMKNNEIVLVVFRPRLEGEKNQVVEAVLARWEGSAVACVGCPASAFCSCKQVVDRFVPLKGVPPRALPSGVKVAGPGYGSSADFAWITVSHLPAITQSGGSAGSGEAPGELIGVMYASDGTVMTRNTITDSNRLFVDFNNDGTQDLSAAPSQQIDYFVNPPPAIALGDFNGTYFLHRLEHDEPYVDIAAYLSVFDDDAVRELYDTQAWDGALVSGLDQRIDDYSQYITENAERIHFNQYTGVALK